MYDHSRIVEISRVARSIKKDTASLVKAIPEEVKDELDEVGVKGERLAQFKGAKSSSPSIPPWGLNKFIAK